MSDLNGADDTHDLFMHIPPVARSRRMMAPDVGWASNYLIRKDATDLAEMLGLIGAELAAVQKA